MEYRQALIHLKDAAGCIHDGINAVGIMSMGLAQAIDPYADGFNAIWNYLADAEVNFQKQLQACLNAE